MIEILYDGRRGEIKGQALVLGGAHLCIVGWNGGEGEWALGDYDGRVFALEQWFVGGAPAKQELLTVAVVGAGNVGAPLEVYSGARLVARDEHGFRLQASEQGIAVISCWATTACALMTENQRWRGEHGAELGPITIAEPGYFVAPRGSFSAKPTARARLSGLAEQLTA